MKKLTSLVLHIQYLNEKADFQLVLAALVKGQPAPISRKDLRWLREHDVLNDAGNFAVPMMERWVRELIED